jgi:hypothetical protein
MLVLLRGSRLCCRFFGKTFCLHLRVEVSLDVSAHANYVGDPFIFEVQRTKIFLMHNHSSSSFQPQKRRQHIPPTRPKDSPFINVAHTEKHKIRIHINTVQRGRPQPPNETCFLMHHIILTLTSLKTRALDLKTNFISLYNFYLRHFFSARNINKLLSRDAEKRMLIFIYFYQTLTETRISRKIVIKPSNIKFNKNPFSGYTVIIVHGRTDGRTEVFEHT